MALLTEEELKHQQKCNKFIKKNYPISDYKVWEKGCDKFGDNLFPKLYGRWCFLMEFSKNIQDK